MKPERSPLPLVIARLARDAAPVTPLPSPMERWRAWTLKAVAVSACVTMLLGFLPGFRSVVPGLRSVADLPLREPGFALAALATCASAMVAAGGAFMLSVPGASHTRLARVAPLLAALAWATVLWTRLDAIGDPLAHIVATPWHPICVVLILGIGALPGIWLFGMLRRAAPLQTRWTGALAALAALALGALGTQFICPIDAPGHQWVWHLSPVVLLTLIGLPLGARAFRLRL